MNPFMLLGTAIVAALAGIEGRCRKRLLEKERQMATMREQLKTLRERLRKMDDYQKAYRELFTKYNALVEENAGNQAALKELTEEFNKEFDETEAAIAEGTPFDPSANTGFDPSANKAASSRKGK